MKIAIGSDHAGFLMKEHIKSVLCAEGYEFFDFGTDSEASMDYPDSAHPVAREVQQGNYPFGILLCGSGNGVAITANKYSGIRAALCWNEEITRLSRLHNDANILAIPARYISKEAAVSCCRIFLRTGFEGGRHLRRIEKISKTVSL